jgi:hypothetical protein
MATTRRMHTLARRNPFTSMAAPTTGTAVAGTIAKVVAGIATIGNRAHSTNAECKVLLSDAISNGQRAGRRVGSRAMAEEGAVGADLAVPVPREKTRPGTIGSQKLRPRNSSVAARETPATFNVKTDAASKAPSPPRDDTDGATKCGDHETGEHSGG